MRCHIDLAQRYQPGVSSHGATAVWSSFAKELCGGDLSTLAAVRIAGQGFSVLEGNSVSTVMLMRGVRGVHAVADLLTTHALSEEGPGVKSIWGTMQGRLHAIVKACKEAGIE